MTNPTRPLPRWHWQNWPVLVKLIGVLLVPTVVALVVGALRIVDLAAAAPAYDRIVAVAGVQQQLSGLVSAIQEERDLAAVYVANDRRGNRSALEAQFATVDEAATDVRAAAAGVEGLAASGLDGALDQLGELVPLRRTVVAGARPAAAVLADYDAAVDPLLTADAALARQLDDPAVSERAVALHGLLSLREQVARQHSLILPVLITDRVDVATVSAIRAAGVRLQSELDALTASLAPDERAQYLGAVTGAPGEARQRIVQLVTAPAAEAPPDVTPAEWDARSGVVTGPLADAEQALRDLIATTAADLLADARATAGWNAVLLLFALALGVVVGFVIARSILRPLGVLRRTALEVADRRLPAAVAGVRDGSAPLAVEPVPVSTDEEIGQVARAFDAVHRQAVRLAAEQAQLRANVNDMFVNLSRRSQGLVQRQLKLIDDLERGEESPEVLDSLFQLDHLATRMRRNSENLLVLAGTESVNRSSRPVRLVDVLRAAVSEVEQYQRLVLQPPPDVLVLGRAASDLVHLLAELLDNATLFSPPSSQVMISARTVEDGSLVIEVDDRGVGMGDAELAVSNQRLAAPPPVDASVSRRMGLFVVGRLAARHDVSVTLRPGVDGVGVTAAIVLPPRLVRSTADELPGGPPVPSPARPVSDFLARPGVPAGTNGNGAPAGNGVSAGNGTGRGGARGLGGGQAQEPPPAAPRPSVRDPLPGAAPAADAGRSSAWDLFRSGSAEGDEQEPLGIERLAQRATLQQATPIFDDVASAWFLENKAVPVHWSGEDTAADPVPGLQRRQPGQVLAQAGAGEERVGAGVSGRAERGTVAAQQGRRADWGSADAGWQAAGALGRSSGAEVTPAGLPRREPKALLVPGAADSGAAARTAGLVRNAEAVRGRLASYQRGVTEGRQVRGTAEDGPGEQTRRRADEEKR